MPTEETGAFIAPAVTPQVSRILNINHIQRLMIKYLHLLLLAAKWKSKKKKSFNPQEMTDYRF